MYRMRRVWPKFRRDSDGSISVVYTLWTPLFITIFLLIVDGSMLLLGQGHMRKVAGDTTLLLAVGAMGAGDAPSYAQAHAMPGQSHNVSVDNDGAGITTTISAPLSEASITGVFSIFSSSISVVATQRLET